MIGINRLEKENAEQYAAVVVINTSMGWEIDYKVESFLKKYGDLDHIIVLTTSDGGDVAANTQNRRIDAISAASIKEAIAPVAQQIISGIEALLKGAHG